MKLSMCRRLGWAGWLFLSCSGLQAFADTADRVPLGLPPTTQETSDFAERIALGRKLFLERRLSADGTISCSTCYDPDRVFSDGRPVAQSIGGKPGTRNVPSLLNARYQHQSVLGWTPFQPGKPTSRPAAQPPRTRPRQPRCANGHPDGRPRLSEDIRPRLRGTSRHHSSEIRCRCLGRIRAESARRQRADGPLPVRRRTHGARRSGRGRA